MAVRFTVRSPGLVGAVRFFKASGEQPPRGGHRAELYVQATGQRLGSSTAETVDDSALCAGKQWVSLPLAVPVGVLPGTIYVAVVQGLQVGKQGQPASQFDGQAGG